MKTAPHHTRRRFVSFEKAERKKVEKWGQRKAADAVVESTRAHQQRRPTSPHAHTHTHTHSHSLTHSQHIHDLQSAQLSRSLSSLSCTLSNSHPLPHTLSHPHTLERDAPSLTHSHSLSHPHPHSLTLTLTLTLSLTHSLAHSLTHSLTLFLPSISLPTTTNPRKS